MMSRGLLNLLGVNPEGNGVMDTRTMLENGDIDPQQATLLSGLLGMEAPIDPGNSFREYMAQQDGAKGFFGSALNPLLSRMLFSDDFDDYQTAKASYGANKTAYESLWDIASANEKHMFELSAVDPQIQELADHYESTGQPLLAKQLLAANSIKDMDLNNRTLGTNQNLVSATGDTVAQGFQDPLAGMPAPVKQAVFLQENPELTESVERQAKIIKDVQNAGDVSRATTDGTNDANTYKEQSNYYIDAIRNDRVIADRIGVLDEGLAMFDENREGGAVDTGFLSGTLFNMFGIGSEDQGRLSQMSISEAMEELANFKGPTTDFEFEKSELKAFASIMRGEDVNVGTLKSARDGLERMRKRNALNAQSALSLATDRDTGGNRIPSLTKAYPQSQYMIDLFSEAEQSQNPAGAAAMPKVGAVIDGYRFKGGNPNEQANWEPVQ